MRDAPSPAPQVISCTNIIPTCSIMSSIQTRPHGGPWIPFSTSSGCGFLLRVSTQTPQFYHSSGGKRGLVG